MPDAAQFSLDLFGSTALGFTVPVPAVVDDGAGDRETGDPGSPGPAAPAVRPRDYVLTGDRPLARGWHARARDNIAAIRLSKEIEADARPATPEEQDKLILFAGFGASALAQNCFPLPGATGFRPGWEETGAALQDSVDAAERAALMRATQYAHYTPGFIVRAMWNAVRHLGFTGGRVLEPGMGTGLFFALMPGEWRDATRLTGVEYDPVTARIARLLHPSARIRNEDFTRSTLRGGFDLAIGNPPFANRPVRTDPAVAKLGLVLHDYFIAAALRRLRPGAIALFATSTGTMDKTNPAARTHIAAMADLLGAVRLPENAMRAAAGTHVAVDILAFRRREDARAPDGPAWTGLETIALDPARAFGPDAPYARVNQYFHAHPGMVLGHHATRRGIYGPGPDYTCVPRDGAGPLEEQLEAALARLPQGVFAPGLPLSGDAAAPEPAGDVRFGRAADGATAKEGSFLAARDGRLCQILNGEPVEVPIRRGAGGAGIALAAAKIVRALIPVRDAVRAILRAQAAGADWKPAQAKLRTAYSAFVRYHGPINRTVVATTKDTETGAGRQSHRRPNLAHFADDPDCWLVASIEDYDADTGTARMGPIFTKRVVAPPAQPAVGTPADALALSLNQTGKVDLEFIAGLLDGDPGDVPAQLGAAIWHDPLSREWLTADAYLSGPVREKLKAAEAAAETDPSFARNVEALREAIPADLPPSDIAARLGSPWLPASDIEAFCAEILGGSARILHVPELGTWTVASHGFAYSAEGTSIWGTRRRDAGRLLGDALNSCTPAVYDYIVEDGVRKAILNEEETEAAKEKLRAIGEAFANWVWTDPDRAERLCRIYNDTYNGLVPRHFDGSHLTLPGASNAISFYPHQKRAVWRALAAGSTYIAHTVGAGKTFSIAAIAMEQQRLGLVRKPLYVVPGHCLAQASREFLQLYPSARILVADETNFAKQKRARFVARAATGEWDAIVITHSAFAFLAVPSDFEKETIETQLAEYEDILARIDGEDRATRKRAEAAKEKLQARLETLGAKQDDMVTLEEMGVDQIIVDEAQMFRKLPFATNRSALKGVDPTGSTRAWHLYVASKFVATKNPGRSLIQASGTPITNTMGELHSLLRFQNEDMLRALGLHRFDAWAATFGDTRMELELQPSGAYKPVERFSQFVNVPELIAMFRTVADVVSREDLAQFVKVPAIRTGRREIVAAPATEAFRGYQRQLAARIAAIEERKRPPEPGDDILLSVITDGRHAAIDLRLVGHARNEEGNKLNLLIRNVHRIWLETSDAVFAAPDGARDPKPGAGQLIFSDLGTESVADTRGFSAYAWIRSELIRLGVPASEIAIAQHFTKAADKQRAFNDFNAGKLRVLIGSTAKMGTGANVQRRLAALHHLDVPWLLSDIEQREGRIVRQGNQHAEVSIYAYATLGSMDATLWQLNERKARFIAAALSGDTAIRAIQEDDGQAAQFAIAKAIASGDGRLMAKAGLEAEIARLERQRDAHDNDQFHVRQNLACARGQRDMAASAIDGIRADLAIRQDTRGGAFSIRLGDRTFAERATAGGILLSKARLAMKQPAPVHPRFEPLGAFGGFDLELAATRARSGPGTAASILIRRSKFDTEIEILEDTAALGLVARLENALSRMEHDLSGEVCKHADAVARIAGYEAREGAPFAWKDLLETRRAELAALENGLKGGPQAVPPLEQHPPLAA